MLNCPTLISQRKKKPRHAIQEIYGVIHPYASEHPIHERHFDWK